jgi:L-lactate utilization protein LutC
MDNELEKSPEFSHKVREAIEGKIGQSEKGFDKAEIAKEINEVREIIRKELGLDDKELEEAISEALVYLAEEIIKDARAGNVSTYEDALDATQAVLIYDDEKGAVLSDHPTQKMVDDGYGAEVGDARKRMEQGTDGMSAEIEENKYDTLKPEQHITDSEDGKLHQLVQDVYKSVEEGDVDEATKSELREAIKKFVGETRAEKIFSEHKANFEPKTHVYNWIVGMKQDLANTDGTGEDDGMDELIDRRIAALQWLEDAFGKMEFEVLENQDKGEMPLTA